jgi:hypothetical protein
MVWRTPKKSVFDRSRRTARKDTRPAPVGGLNVRDSIAAMPDSDAIVLRNFFPQPYGCLIRKGYRQHAIGFTGTVETVMAWNNQATSIYPYPDSKLFAAVGGEIFDVTTAGDFSAATPEATGFTNDRWQYVNFSNSAGAHLIAFNGKDDAFLYDSLGVQSITSGDGTTVNTIATVDPKDVIHCTIHQRRLWMVRDNSTKAYYLPQDAIYGVAVLFDFGPLFKNGGYLNALYTWSVDSGTGSDDHLVALSSEGEIVIYKGTDPASSATWGLVGVYTSGAPVGRRCALPYAGDLLILNEFGLTSLSSFLTSTKVENAVTDITYTDKIKSLVSELITTTRYIFGWQLVSFPSSNMVILNCPKTEGGGFQLAMNTITRAWGEFDGMEASCWEMFHQAPFFGADGVVYRAWEGGTDNATSSGSGGVAVQYEAQTNFSHFKNPGVPKIFGFIRPTFTGNGDPSAVSAVNVNYSLNGVSGGSLPLNTNDAIWDSTEWGDSTYVWAGGTRVFQQWRSVGAMGEVASHRLRGQTSAEALWVSDDWLWAEGTGL